MKTVKCEFWSFLCTDNLAGVMFYDIKDLTSYFPVYSAESSSGVHPAAAGKRKA